MKPNHTFFLVLFLGFFFSGLSYIFAQKKISLDIENDLPISDGSYTFGHFLTYQKKLNKNFKLLNIRQENIRFSLQQELYTPKFISSKNTDFFDRPFASYLGASVRLSAINERSIVQTTFSIGASGAITGGHDLQKWYHINILSDSAVIPSNTDVIANSLHLNSYVSYARDFLASKSKLPVFVSGKGSFGLGTRDIFSELGLSLSFGNRLGLGESLLFDEIGWGKEFFFFGNMSYRFVLYDAMLQGNLLGDQSRFTVDPKASVFLAEAGVGVRTGKLEFRLSHHYNSKRTSLEEAHHFNSLQLAYLFD